MTLISLQKLLRLDKMEELLQDLKEVYGGEVSEYRREREDAGTPARRRLRERQGAEGSGRSGLC